MDDHRNAEGAAIIGFKSQEDYKHWAWKDDIEDILFNISIEDGWELLLREDEVYKDKDGNGRLYLQIQFEAPDNMGDDPPTVERQFCRKWYLSPYMTKQEVVRTAYKAYQAAVLHETAEKFTYKNKMIYSPHFDVDILANVLEEDKRANH